MPGVDKDTPLAEASFPLLDVIGKSLMAVLTAAIIGLFVQVQGAGKELVLLRGDLALIAQTSKSDMALQDERVMKLREDMADLKAKVTALNVRASALELRWAERDAQRRSDRRDEE